MPHAYPVEGRLLHLHAPPANLELQRRELDSIEKSRLFARAGKLRQLMRWLGDRAISGEIERPSEYTVGVKALGKPPDFDPSYDVSVRQLKRRMCARLAQYYMSEGIDSRFRLVCDRGFVVRFETIPARAAKFPRLVVTPLHGDDSGVLTGSLSHALMETGRLQVVSRTALQVAHGAEFFIEGELLRHSGGTWELTARLVDAANGHVPSGLRLDGHAAVGQPAMREAAGRLVALILAEAGSQPA